MTLATTYPNRLAEERAAYGIDSPAAFAALVDIDAEWYVRIEAGELLPTLDEFDRIRAALGDIHADRLYVWGIHRTIGASKAPDERPDYAAFWGDYTDASHLLVSRDEQTWIERNITPDRTVDVVVNLSCGPQHSPHINLDTVASLKALGVNFAAGAGPLFCCGTNYRLAREMGPAERMRSAAVARTVAWGAKKTVHMCTQCQNTFGETELRQRARGENVPENVQLHTFVEELLLGSGDPVPWKKRVEARVLVLRQDISPVHMSASDTTARWLRLVPGVTVVGFIDAEIQKLVGHKNAFQIMEDARPSREEMARLREGVADLFAARGADTMAAMHHTGQQWWSRLSSDRLTVKHPFSILAEALGVASPDRYQTACKLGDPEAVLEQLRPIWTSWGMREVRARELAAAIFDPAYSDGVHCGCGGKGGCRGEELIDIDLLTAKPRVRSH
jgi:hypothetical protein